MNRNIKGITEMRRMKLRESQGFTLVELMIAMVVAGLVMAAIYGVYVFQQKYYIAQTQVAQMQQNIRAAMEFIASDLRMAGYDDTGGSAATIINMQDDLLYFTIDRNDDGDVTDNDEHVVYDLYIEDGVSFLGRTTSNTTITINDMGGGHYEATGHVAAAQVIEALQFDYYESYADNDTTTDPEDVRTIVVSMLARAELEDPEFTNAATYPIGGPWPTNDNYRRRFHQMTIQCRNMGL